MSFLAMTQGTAEWLLGKLGLVDVLYGSVLSHRSVLSQLKEFEFAEGPVRLSTSDDGDILALWHTDYLSGRDDEAWGFIKISGDHSIESRPDIAREVLERGVYIINQRLQNLVIDGAFIHRSYASGAHTCLAGRGSTARQVSIGYFESQVDIESGTSPSVIIVGPVYDFNVLEKAAVREGKALPKLVAAANKLISSNRKKPAAPAEVLTDLRSRIAPYHGIEGRNEYGDVEVQTEKQALDRTASYQSLGFTYDEWLSPGSPLTELQRRIIFTDVIQRHPLRIVGPGGSGKTLLMQLLALRLLRYAEEGRNDLRVLYVAHNNAMAEKVRQRFAVLDPSFERFGRGADREIVITTLAAYGLKELSLPTTSVIDPDAEGSKSFQKEAVAGALKQALAEGSQVARESSLFRLGLSEPIIFDVLAQLVVAEISMAIKGHGLENDRRRYIESERRFSRFHGLLNRAERELVYRAFEIYHKQVFEELEVLDSDDIAISLLGRLRTPIWELKRRKLGFDFVFVDETQLFNENERRVLPMLTNRARAHVAVVLALDEAQDVYSQSSAGLATLGFHDIASESLASIHRSTRAIVRLAFFVIQRSTDLFGPDFPDFTSVAETMVEDNHPLAAPPRIDVVSEETKQTKPMGKFVLKRIRELRKANVRQIAVICHSEMYWDNLIEVFSASDLPLYVVTERGAKLPPEEPLVVLSKPAFIGGQEFDAVVLVGLEQGVVPPRVNDSEALGSAVEQQALREMYVSITRARYRVHIVLSAGVAPTPVLQDAEREGLLTRR